MCGFIRRVTDHPSVVSLLLDLGMDNIYLGGGDFYPGGKADIIVEDPTLRAANATWWFLIGPDGKPNYKYATFNARHLDSKLWQEPVKTSRCLIPATAFGESIGEGKAKKSYLLESGSAFLLGGVYRHYETDNGPVTGFSVITCNPNPRLAKYHDKSCPLFLPAQRAIVEPWLDPNVSDLALFHDLIDHPQLPTDFVVTPVKSVKKLDVVGEKEQLDRDE